MNKGAETQGDVQENNPDLEGFDSLPAPPFDWTPGPVWALWGGLVASLLGSLYLVEGATFRGFALIVLGVLFVKAYNDA